MLQKLEGEVRNHIKIEQQLKLHIECIQDKFEDACKERDQVTKQRSKTEDLAASQAKINEKLEKEVEKYKVENEKMTKQIEQLNREVKELKMQAKENQKRSVSTLINAINEKSTSTLGQHNYVVPLDSEYDIHYQGESHLSQPLQGLYHQVNQSAVKLPGGPYMSNQQLLPTSSLNDNQINSERLQQVSTFDAQHNNTARKTTMMMKQGMHNNTFYKQIQSNI